MPDPTIPAAFPVVDPAGLTPGQPVWGKTWTDLVEESNFLAAYRVGHHFSQAYSDRGPSGTSAVSTTNTAFEERIDYLITTGPGKAALTRLTFQVEAASTAAGSTVRFEVITTGGTVVATVDITVDGATAFLAGEATALSPETDYRIKVSLKAAASATLTLHSAACWETPVVAGDLP